MRRTDIYLRISPVDRAARKLKNKSNNWCVNTRQWHCASTSVQSRYASNVAQTRKSSSAWMIYPFACALVVIGAKCWMISHYASPTPFWDQWDAEGGFLYPKYFDGTLSFSDLIAPHNEHRILVSRLWSLLLLELEGYWDPMLQMVANTLILGAAVALFIAAFRPILDRRSWLVFALFSMVIFSLPFSWENTLAGFHSAWHFLLLFSISGLVVISDAEAFTPRWWLAALLLILSYFSIAGGALTVAAAFAISMVQFVAGRRSGLARIAGAGNSSDRYGRNGTKHPRDCGSRAAQSPLSGAISSGTSSHHAVGRRRPASHSSSR